MPQSLKIRCESLLNEIEIILITLLAAIIVAVAQYILKKSINIFKFNISSILSISKNIGLWLGIVLYIVSLAVYLVALGSGNLSFVYPTFATSFVFVLIISGVLLKEKTDIKRILGILLIVAGVVLVGLTF